MTPKRQLPQTLLTPQLRLPPRLDEGAQHVANEEGVENNVNGSTVEEVAYDHHVKDTYKRVTLPEKLLGKGEEVEEGMNMPPENAGNEQKEVEDDAHMSGARER
jgi:hypothetical protein